MDLTHINEKSKATTAQESTNRDDTKVKLDHPGLFRKKLGCLKDRLEKHLNSEAKKICKKKIKQTHRSRNGVPIAAATCNNMENIKLNYRRPEYMATKEILNSNYPGSVAGRTLNTRHTTHNTDLGISRPYKIPK